MASYKSCTDAAEIYAKAKMNKYITLHDDDAWETLVRATDATAPDTMERLVV